MRRNARGFTLLEVMVVVAIIGLLAAITVGYGMSARQASNFASTTWELSLRLSALRARALYNMKDYVLVVMDASDAEKCRASEQACGRAYVFSSPTPEFKIDGFDFEPGGGTTVVAYEEELALPRNSQLEPTSTWKAPVPFDAVKANDADVWAECADKRACFAIRYKANGDVEPVFKGTPANPGKAGFAFVLKPVFAESKAAERRALFVSFPTGIVKTAAF